MLFLFFAVALLGGLLLASPGAHAQGKRKVIQFTGIVATGDSLLGVPGATVYVPKAGRGTASNAYGYFSMAVLAGDSIVIRSLGYANQTIIIPKDFQRLSYSVIVQLKEDATVLPEVRVFPYTTERDFKKAFLALRLPTERGSAAADNLNQELMNKHFPDPAHGRGGQLPPDHEQPAATTTTAAWASPPTSIPTTRCSTLQLASAHSAGEKRASSRRRPATTTIDHRFDGF